MTDRYICDCGQTYPNQAGVALCQQNRHAGSGEAEVADAQRLARDWGVDPGPGTESLRFDPRGNLTVTNATIVRGFQRGDVVFIENDRDLDQDQFRQLSVVLEHFSKHTGVKCLLLMPGMRAVGKKSRDE